MSTPKEIRDAANRRKYRQDAWGLYKGVLGFLLVFLLFGYSFVVFRIGLIGTSIVPVLTRTGPGYARSCRYRGALTETTISISPAVTEAEQLKDTACPPSRGAAQAIRLTP